MDIFSLVVELLRALAAYLRYRFDPAMVLRRDEIHLNAIKDKNREEIDRMFAGGDTITLAYFLSESVRIMRLQETDSPDGRKPSFSDRIFPKRGEGPDPSNEDRPDIG